MTNWVNISLIHKSGCLLCPGCVHSWPLHYLDHKHGSAGREFQCSLCIVSIDQTGILPQWTAQIWLLKKRRNFLGFFKTCPFSLPPNRHIYVIITYTVPSWIWLMPLASFMCLLSDSSVSALIPELVLARVGDITRSAQAENGLICPVSQSLLNCLVHE